MRNLTCHHFQDQVSFFVEILFSISEECSNEIRRGSRLFLMFNREILLTTEWPMRNGNGINYGDKLLSKKQSRVEFP